jgi:hypothetical protein
MHEASEFTREYGLKQSLEEYAEIYGEENARYLWDTIHKNAEDNNRDIMFIDIPELSDLGFKEKAEQWARENNKNLIYQKGAIDIIRNLISGDWNDDEFLILEPGQKIDPVYDWDEIIKAE